MKAAVPSPHDPADEAGLGTVRELRIVQYGGQGVRRQGDHAVGIAEDDITGFDPDASDVDGNPPVSSCSVQLLGREAGGSPGVDGNAGSRALERVDVGNRSVDEDP